jgi:pyruvate, water dikinase
VGFHCYLGELEIPDVLLPAGQQHIGLTPNRTFLPEGFCVISTAYKEALDRAGYWGQIDRLLEGSYKWNARDLSSRSASARDLVYRAAGMPELRDQIYAAYRELETRYGENVAVTVQSSVIAEELPTATLPEPHESFRVHGADAVFDACRRCFASTFAERAITYRDHHNLNHLTVRPRVIVMKINAADRTQTFRDEDALSRC